MHNSNFTSADFNFSDINAAARCIKFFIKFPVHRGNDILLTADDYLVDVNVVEEIWTESSDIMGEISPSAVDVTLLNTNKLFSPENTSSPYANIMKLNTEFVLSFLRSDTIEYEKEHGPILFGTYYVSEWTANADDNTATIHAVNGLQRLLDLSKNFVGVSIAVPYNEFIANFIDYIGDFSDEHPVFNDTVFSDQLSTSILPYGWCEGTVKAGLNTLLQAALAMIIIDRINTFNVLPIQYPTVPTEYCTLTDNDQIISINTNRSLIRAYNTTKLTYYVASIQHHINVLTLDNIDTCTTDQNGTVVFGRSPLTYNFNTTPVVYIEAITCTISDGTAHVTSVQYNTESITFSIFSNVNNTASIDATATVVNLAETVLIDSSTNSNAYEYTNKLIQTEQQAKKVLAYMNKQVYTDASIIEVEIYGDLTIELSDIVHVQSIRYSLDFMGRVVRIKTSYNNGLKQTLYLMNSSLFTESSE